MMMEKNKPDWFMVKAHDKYTHKTVRDSVSKSDIAAGFLATTTTHGLPRIRKGLWHKKVMWIFVFLLSIVGFLYTFISITTWYADHAVDTRTEFLHKRKLQFPSVTVCNMNPIKYSSLYLSPRLSSLLTKWGIPVQNKRRRKRSTEDKCTVFSDDGKKCFWLGGPVQLFYANGELKCEGDGGTIAAVSSPLEMKYIYDALLPFSALGNAQAFLNLHYDDVKDDWLWYGDTPATWTEWINPYPSQSASKPCLVSKVSPPYSWKNVPCTSSSSAYYVCEYYIDGRPGAEGDATTAKGVEMTTEGVQTTKEGVETTTEAPVTTTVERDFTTEGSETTTLLVEDQTTENDYVETTESVITMTSIQSTTSSQTTMPAATPAPIPVPKLTTRKRTTATTTKSTPTNPPFIPTYDPIPGLDSAFPDRKPLTAQFIFENEVLEFLADAPIDLKKSLGYTFGDLILDCHFQKKSCMDSVFASFFDAQHGNCFVFNSDWLNETTERFTSYKPGKSVGLELVINIDQEEYIPNLIDGAGAVVVVHPSSRMPFPEDEGVLALPGEVTSMGITQIKIDRLGGLYGNCTSLTKNRSRNVFEEEHNVSYSISACSKTCYQYHVIQACGCADPQYPITGEAFDKLKEGKVMACDSQNVTEEDCVYNVTLQYNGNRLECDCPNTCSETLYKHQVSTTEWPAEIYEDDMLDLYSDRVTYDNSDGSDKFRENILKVEVYYSQFNYKHITEKPKYTLYHYISDVGANLGLWLGMSAVSIFELFELLLDVTVYSCFKKWKNGKRQNGKGTNLIPDGKSKQEYPWGNKEVNGMLKSVQKPTSKNVKIVSISQIPNNSSKRDSLCEVLPSVDAAINVRPIPSSTKKSSALLSDPISSVGLNLRRSAVPAVSLKG